MALKEPLTAAPLADDDAQAIFSDINITPLTDVILVLLIIFMVSSSAMVDAAREGHLEVSLPQAGAARAPTDSAEPLVVGMLEDGSLFADGKKIDEAELETLLQETHARAPHTVVIIDADGQLSHRRVVRVIDRVRAAGFEAVGIGAEHTQP